MKNRLSSFNWESTVTTPATDGLPEDNLDFDLPVVIFPEWNDADIAAEKWTTKIQFEDNDTIIYPRSLRGKFDHYKKPAELVSDGQSPVVMQTQAIQDDIFHGDSSMKGPAVGFSSSFQALNLNGLATNEVLLEKSSSELSINEVGKSDFNNLSQSSAFPEELSSRQSVVNISKAPSMQEMDSIENSESLGKTSKLFQANLHLLNSRMMIHVLNIFHFIYDQGKSTRQSPGEEFCLWDCIYPKGKDGLPTYNPSGRYAVKLFWLGSWRKIIVDDRIPCCVDGKPIVISSPLITELWPVLITKAILKIAVYSYKEVSEFPEHGDFDVLYALKGMLPEKLHFASDSNKLWNYLQTLSNRLTHQFNSLSRSSSPNRERQTSIMNNSMSGRNASALKAESPLVIFSYRNPQNSEREYENTDPKTLGFYFRICEFKEVEQTNEEEMDSARYVRVRGYFSCGVRKRRMLTPSPAKKAFIFGDDTDGIDSWIPFDDFFYIFSDVIVYHYSSSFRNIKSYQYINDPAKPNDIYRITPIIHSLEDTKEAEILINISTFGRANYQTTTLSVEPYSWPIASNHSPVIQTSTNSVGTVLLKIPNKEKGYSFVVDCSTSYCITFLSKNEFGLEDEAKYLQEIAAATVKDYEESYVAQPSGSWSIIFKQILYFSDPLYFSANLFLPDNAQAYATLKMVNNDDYSIVPNSFYYLRSRYYFPNTSGYTLIAELKTPFARPTGKFKVRLISETPILATPERPLDVWTKGLVQDFDEIYVANKHNHLFRYLLKIKEGNFNPASIQVSFSIPDLPLKFQLFDHENLIFSISGRGVVTIPLYIFYPSEDQTTKTAEKTKEEKSNSAREKNNTSQGSARPTQLKHKYILQANIDKPPYFSVSNTLSNFESSTRPSSRGLPVRTVGIAMDKSSPSRKNRKNNVPNLSEEKTPSLPNAAEPTWKLRIISSDSSSMVVMKDTEKEDRFRSIKESWESSQPGRSMRANEVRDAYLRSVDNKTIQPIFMPANFGTNAKYKPWKRINSRPSTSESDRSTAPSEITKIPYLDEAGWARIQSERECKLKSALEEISNRRSNRKNQKDIRISENKLKDMLSVIATEFEEYFNIDSGKRSEYRSRVLLEAEEVAKAKDAAKNSDLNSGGLAEDADKKKKAKK